jgi:hypothetical protein
MILGKFRYYLGRGWTFDNIEESTGISPNAHMQFLHAFIKFDSTTILYSNYIKSPTNPQMANRHKFDMTQAGFPGLSIDASTHVPIE